MDGQAQNTCEDCAAQAAGEAQEPHVDNVAQEFGTSLLTAECSTTHVDSEPNGHVLIGAKLPAQDDTPAIDNSALLGRGHQKKEPSVRLRDYVTHSTQELSPSNCAPRRQHLPGIPYPISHYASCDKFSSPHKKFHAVITSGHEPMTYSDVATDERWRDVMQQEINALEDNETLKIVNLLPGKKALGCKWVFKIKYRSDGQVECYKARLVTFGNHQIVGIEFTNTFTLVRENGHGLDISYGGRS